MTQKSKMMKLPADLHDRAVALDKAVIERFGPPPNYRRGGPGAAVHAGLKLLEAVLKGEQRIIPADLMRRYEATRQDAGFLRTENALLSTMMLAVAMGWAEEEGAENIEARASEIAAETIRAFVESEIMEAEAEAAPANARALRMIARQFLDDAERLFERARAARSREVAK